MKKIKLFFEGLSTIIKYSVVTDNISINKSSSSPVYINDDLEALRNDWETVGNNLKASIENYKSFIVRLMNGGCHNERKNTKTFLSNR